VTSIHTIIVLSPDIESLCDFYVRALKLPAPSRFGKDHLGIRLDNGVYLGFDEEPGVQPSRTVSLWFDSPNIHTTHKRCIQLGATSENAPRRMPWGDEIASLLDPDGNRFGLRQLPPAGQPI
jgi:predicted enzyme related to lactoylglutathione lyase